MASWFCFLAQQVQLPADKIGPGVVSILFRWLHITSAALAIGGLFFMRLVLPSGLKLLDEKQREEVFLRCRRIFKMLIHTCILLLLASGTYNSIKYFPQYKLNPPLLHGLWGAHIFLGLAIFAISLWLLMGKTPPQGHRKWGLINVVLLLAIVAVGSTTKWARETVSAAKAPAPAAPTPGQ